jgi:amino acid transporter
VVGVLTIALLYVNVDNPLVFLALTSVCILLLYIAYLMVTVPLLFRRLRGGLPAAPGLFSLGRLGAVVNVVAIAWGLFMAVNLAWPRTKVYGTEWYLQYVPQLFLAGAVVLGAVAYAVQRAQRVHGATVAQLEAVAA